MSPEKLGEMVAQNFIKTPEFRAEVEALAAVICDELVYNLAQKVRDNIEKALGLTWDDSAEGEDKHYEFGMTFEGDIHKAALDILANCIRNY
jgi:hypothetical protein